MLGYDVSCRHNDSYAFRQYPHLSGSQKLHQQLVPVFSGQSHSGVRRCPRCGDLLAKWDEPLNGLCITDRRYDISCTYDGIMIGSHRLKEVIQSHGLTGLRFIALPDDSVFFQIQATDVVAFDAERRGTRFERQCSVCGHFESVVGATPVYLKPGSRIPDRGFVRTDIEFGSGDEKSPLILCGPFAGKVLKDAKLKGLDLAEVKGTK